MKRLTSVALVCLFLAALGAITATPPVEAQTVKPEAPRITKATYNRLDRIVVRFTAPDDPNVDGYVVNLDGSRVRSVVVPRDKRRLAIPADELTAGAEHTIFVKAITADGTLSRHSNRVKVRVPNDHPQTNPPAQSGETINRVAAVLRHLGCDDARAGTFAAVGVFTIDELFANADICIATPIPTTTTTGPPRTVPTTEAPITIPGDDGPEPTPSTTDPSAPLPAPSIVSAVKCSDIENSNITFLFSSTVEERDPGHPHRERQDVRGDRAAAEPKRLLDSGQHPGPGRAFGSVHPAAADRHRRSDIAHVRSETGDLASVHTSRALDLANE